MNGILLKKGETYANEPGETILERTGGGLEAMAKPVN